MVQNEILIAIMDLLNAMEQKNLTQTKELVAFLNNNFIPSQDVPTYDDFIPIADLYQSNTNNEAFFYVIFNLNHLSSNKELQWNLMANYYIKKSNNEILDFIMNVLQHNNYLSNAQANCLIRLSIKIHNYDILNDIRKKIKEGE